MRNFMRYCQQLHVKEWRIRLFPETQLLFDFFHFIFKSLLGLLYDITWIQLNIYQITFLIIIFFNSYHVKMSTYITNKCKNRNAFHVWRPSSSLSKEGIKSHNICFVISSDDIYHKTTHALFKNCLFSINQHIYSWSIRL